MSPSLPPLFITTVNCLQRGWPTNLLFVTKSCMHRATFYPDCWKIPTIPTCSCLFASKHTAQEDNRADRIKIRLATEDKEKLWLAGKMRPGPGQPEIGWDKWGINYGPRIVIRGKLGASRTMEWAIRTAPGGSRGRGLNWKMVNASPLKISEYSATPSV